MVFGSFGKPHPLSKIVWWLSSEHWNRFLVRHSECAVCVSVLVVKNEGRDCMHYGG